MATPADQLSKTLKTDTLGLPDVSKMRKSSDVLAAKQALIPKQAEAESRLKEAELGIETGIAGVKARAAEEYAGKEREALGQYEAGIKATPLPEFKMTEDTAMTMGSLFSLTATLGIMLGASGKSSANRALAAMTGMLQGWQAGRQDLYQREKAKYEKEFARVQAVHADLRQTFNDYVKLLATDREAANLKGEELVRKAGSSSIIAAYKDKGQLDKIDKMLDGAAAQLRHQEDLANRLEAARARGAGRGGAGGTAGAIQFRYNNAMVSATNSAVRNVENLTSLPLGTPPPALGNWVADPSHSITDGLLKYMSQSLTEADERLFQQYTAALTRELGVVAAQGRPGGSGEGMMKEISRIQPQAKDKIINTYAYLAIVKQFFDVAVEDLQTAGATPEQIAQAVKNRDAVRAKIPWDVEDINRIVRAGGASVSDSKIVETLKNSSNYEEFLNFFDSLREKDEKKEASAPPAQAAGKPEGAPADAKRAADGHWYSPDPDRPGKWLKWD